MSVGTSKGHSAYVPSVVGEGAMEIRVVLKVENFILNSLKTHLEQVIAVDRPNLHGGLFLHHSKTFDFSIDKYPFSFSFCNP